MLNAIGHRWLAAPSLYVFRLQYQLEKVFWHIHNRSRTAVWIEILNEVIKVLYQTVKIEGHVRSCE